MPTTYTVGHIQEMRTPRWLFQRCQDLMAHEFLLDAFASKDNALCKYFYTAEQDALRQNWERWTFCNPPFKLMSEVVDKCIVQASRLGVETILIGPAGCSQKWFHKLLVHADVYFPDKRIAFDHPDGTPSKAPMADAAVYHVTRLKRGSPRVYVLQTPR